MRRIGVAFAWPTIDKRDVIHKTEKYMTCNVVKEGPSHGHSYT